jgi:hypothetical protein
MKKIFFILLVFLLLFDFFLLLFGKIHLLGKILIVKENNYTLGGQRYADLYRFCKVDAFKEVIDYGVPIDRNDSLDYADILIIGDSFFGVIGPDDFAQTLRKRSGLKITSISNMDEGALWNPLVVIQDKTFNISKKRILILESAERYSTARAKWYPKLNPDLLSKYSLIEDISNGIFTFSDLNFFFNNNILLEQFIDFRASFLFKYTNEIDKNIGSYSLNPNLLFYKEEVSFDRDLKSKGLIDQTAENILIVSKILETKYNIKLIYVVIPNKFSIYNDYVNGKYEYDNFIPLLCKELDERHVLNINLYDSYMNYRRDGGTEWLYYKSDTHFTQFGREFLVLECLDLISKNLKN